MVVLGLGYLISQYANVPMCQLRKRLKVEWSYLILKQSNKTFDKAS